jgi:hypothetical protein
MKLYTYVTHTTMWQLLYHYVVTTMSLVATIVQLHKQKCANMAMMC